MKRRVECRPIVTDKGLIVPAPSAYCDRALERGLRFLMDPEGRCYLPYDVAVKLGLCREENGTNGGAAPQKQGERVPNYPLRFMEILRELEKRGRKAVGIGVSVSEDVARVLDDLSRRLKRPRSHVAEALLRIGLEAIGVPVGGGKPAEEQRAAHA